MFRVRTPFLWVGLGTGAKSFKVWVWVEICGFGLGAGLVVAGWVALGSTFQPVPFSVLY